MLETQTQVNFQSMPRRAVISKFVVVAYVAPGRYVVEFRRAGRVWQSKQRPSNNRWLAYLYAITRLEPFTGGMRVLIDQ